MVDETGQGLGNLGTLPPPGGDRPLTELEIYTAYRDYIKHEDTLLNARLSTFVATNAFLMTAAVAVLAAMVALATKGKVDLWGAATLVIGASAVTLLAFVGHGFARFAAEWIKAATDSLARLRKKGNKRLASVIARGDLPHLTDGRRMGRRRREEHDRRIAFVHELPRGMKAFWIWIGALTWAFTLLVGLVALSEQRLQVPAAQGTAKLSAAVVSEPRGQSGAAHGP